MTRAHEGYDALVLEGGGCRCFFSLGFLEAAAGSLPGVRQIAAASAASLIACVHLLGEHRAAVERYVRFARAAAARPRSLAAWWRRLREGWLTEPYRRFVAESLDAERFARLRRQPVRVRVLWATGPGPSRLMLYGLAAATLVRQRTHPRMGRRVVELGALDDHHQAIDTVLASSGFPPMTPMPVRGGVAVMDGSVAEPMPVSALDGASRPLMIMSQNPPPRPLPPGLARIGPARDLDVATFSIADEAGVWRAYHAGLRAGERFAARGGVSDWRDP